MWHTSFFCVSSAFLASLWYNFECFLIWVFGATTQRYRHTTVNNQLIINVPLQLSLVRTTHLYRPSRMQVQFMLPMCMAHPDGCWKLHSCTCTMCVCHTIPALSNIGFWVIMSLLLLRHYNQKAWGQELSSSWDGLPWPQWTWEEKRGAAVPLSRGSWVPV